MVSKPRSEDAEVLLDVFDRRGAQAEPDLFDVAQRSGAVEGRDRFPARDRDRRLDRWPSERVDLGSVKQWTSRTKPLPAGTF